MTKEEFIAELSKPEVWLMGGKKGRFAIASPNLFDYGDQLSFTEPTSGPDLVLTAVDVLGNPVLPNPIELTYSFGHHSGDFDIDGEHLVFNDSAYGRSIVFRLINDALHYDGNYIGPSEHPDETADGDPIE